MLHRGDFELIARSYPLAQDPSFKGWFSKVRSRNAKKGSASQSEGQESKIGQTVVNMYAILGLPHFI